MAIEFECPACRNTLQVGDETAGRVIRCGGCMNALRVPEADDARAAPPNPYGNERTSPPPPPRAAAPVPPDAPEPRRRRDPEDPYDDRPRRPRRDPNDPYDDRPRRRGPPPPPGRGVFFWLVIVGAVMMLGAVGCCGGLFFLLPGPKWQKHESENGGYRVELPGKPQRDVGKGVGLQRDKNTQSEGAIIIKRAQQFAVSYRDVPSTKERATKKADTDEQLITKEIEAVRAATQGKAPERTEAVVVGGFDGREVEYQGKSGWYTVRVVVADTRVFVLLAGGGMAEQGDLDARKFIDSFEIIKKELVDEGTRRAEQAKLAADAAKQAKERGAAREGDDLRAAAEAVAGAAIDAAERAARKAPPDDD